MRDNKTWSQTKALYSYLWVRADYKTGLSYPTKQQIIDEVRLTDKQFNECLGVLIKKGYVKLKDIKKTSENGTEYVITGYDLNDYDLQAS